MKWGAKLPHCNCTSVPSLTLVTPLWWMNAVSNIHNRMKVNLSFSHTHTPLLRVSLFSCTCFTFSFPYSLSLSLSLSLPLSHLIMDIFSLSKGAFSLACSVIDQHCTPKTESIRDWVTYWVTYFFPLFFLRRLTLLEGNKWRENGGRGEGQSMKDGSPSDPNDVPQSARTDASEWEERREKRKKK